MSFDVMDSVEPTLKRVSQSLWNRAMSFDTGADRYWNRFDKSQSLWNRAMSFDSPQPLQ